MSGESTFDELLGKTILDKSGSEVALSSFTGDQKYVGLYFSAHWCPPCRGFTPVLAEFYNEMKSSGKGLEIIFVSSDKDEDSFNSYYATMPWLALPFADREKKGQLCQKFGVSGIPTFVLLDGSTGTLITKDGRGCVQGDMKGAKFPWK